MKLPISDRLLACAAFVAPGDRVADIGCDHGYLSIFFSTASPKAALPRTSTKGPSSVPSGMQKSSASGRRSPSTFPTVSAISPGILTLWSVPAWAETP